MLTAAQRARLAVVLVGARNPQNIGAAARALQDFGFSDLRVVNEFAASFEGAQLEAKSAVGAHRIMQNARRYDRLDDAIADCTLVAGTTAIGGRELRREVVALQSAAPTLLHGLAGEHERAALLFGSEKTGLTNDQLSHCELLVTIPLFAPENERHLSMNLGQAVAVCLYELARAGFEGSRELPERPTVQPSAADRERVTAQLLAAMEHTGYARRFPANAREPVVRALARQLGTTRDEIATWLGFLRQVQRNGPDHAA